MSSTVRRAGAFAAVGTMALSVPFLQVGAAAPFAVIAALALFRVRDGRLFDLFARPGEHSDRRLYGLIGFTLSASGLVLLAAVSTMSSEVAVGTILLVAYGNVAVQAARERTERPGLPVVAFAVVGSSAALVGQVVTRLLEGGAAVGALPGFVFLAAAGGLLGALLRSVLFANDDPHVMLSVALWLWLLSELAGTVGAVEVGLALAITVALGYASYALETASVPGMLSGVSIGLVTVVLGGLGWFAVMTTFFGVGGLSTKFRYEEKLDRGVAESNEGARGAANVLANGAVALLAVVCYATVEGSVAPFATVFPADGDVFLFAFAGALSTAMADTLSSEVGGVFDDPRLITTLEPADPGTDGAVTWQGELAGVCGAALVAGVAAAGIDAVGAPGAGAIVVAGVAGMTADSLFGATVEGRLVGNSGVNFLATAVGGVVGAAAAVALGAATLAGVALPPV